MSSITLDKEMYTQKYSVVRGLENEEAASLALNHQLYIKDRLLHRALITCKLKGTYRIIVAQDQFGTPVGVGMMVKGLFHVYVQRQHRRQGVGTMIVKAIQAHVSGKIIGAPGIPGWDIFFKKNGITCYHVLG